MNRAISLLAVILILVSTPLAMGAVETGHADLSITSESWADQPTRTETDDGTPVYVVHGQSHVISLQNAPHENVETFGVGNPAATFRQDDGSDHYVFEATEEGTYEVFFVVEETRAVEKTENNSTVTVDETVTTRYEAIIKVEDVHYVHKPKAEYDDLSNASANWSQVETYCDEVLPNKDYNTCVSRAFNAVRTIQQPFANLEGTITTMLTLRFTTIGGILWTGLQGIGLIVIVRGLATEVQRYRGRLVDVKEIDEQAARNENAAAKKSMQKIPLADVMNDHHARALREKLGLRNLWDLSSFVLATIHPMRIKTYVLRGMGHDGYWADVTRAQAGHVESVRLFREEDEEDARERVDGDLVDLTTIDEDDDVLDAIEYRDLDSRAVVGNVERINLPLVGDDDLETYIEESQLAVPEEFDDARAFAECLGTAIQDAAKHAHFTDDDSRIRPERHLLAVLMDVVTVATDMYDVHLDFYADVLLAISEEDDIDARLDASLEGDSR